MPSFSDSLDRLTLATKSLTSLSQPPTDSAPSFARALLRAPTALLIRDADASEHGLFVVQPGAQLAKTKALSGAPGMGAATTTAAGPAAGGLGRAAFLAATPLRPRPAAVRAQEPKPEVYAAAALKQLDRFQGVRAMPRARAELVTLSDQLSAARQSILDLRTQLQGGKGADMFNGKEEETPAGMAEREEREIREMQLRMAQLKKRKEALIKKKSSTRSTSTYRTRTPPLKSTPPSKASAEESFWTTPGVRAQTAGFTRGMLTDESVDLSRASFASPAPTNRDAASTPQETSLASTSTTSTRSSPRIPFFGRASSARTSVLNGAHAATSKLDVGHVEDEDVEEVEDDTVVLTKPPLFAPRASSLPDAEELEEEDEETTMQRVDAQTEEADTTVRHAPPHVEPEPADETSGEGEVVITPETERIVAKIWATMGETIMPGHPYDVSSAAAANAPPGAEETMRHLDSVSAAPPPADVSPTASAYARNRAAQASAQQALTAKMLLVLLRAPGHAVALDTLKGALAGVEGAAAAAAGGTGAGAGSGVTKVVYGCVAKRLVKIERGGGEQVVKFNV